MRNNIVLNEPLSRHTSWKVGGPADIFFTPNDRKDLSDFLKSNDCIITWLGNGTNILVRDAGVRGAVISTRKSLNKIEVLFLYPTKKSYHYKNRTVIPEIVSDTKMSGVVARVHI